VTCESLADGGCPSKSFSTSRKHPNQTRIHWNPGPDRANLSKPFVPISMAARIPWRNQWLRVGVISTPGGLRLLSSHPKACDIVELRIDMLIARGATQGDLQSVVRSAVPPLLFTFRSPAEGGAIPADDRLRMKILAQLSRAGTAVDFEYALLPEDFIENRKAIARGAVLILSAHCFERELSEHELEERLAAMRRIPAKIYKFASLCNTEAALGALEAVQRRHPHDTTFMGMGERAEESRRRLPPAGARLLYGFLDKPSAPGQPPASHLPVPPT